MDRKRIDEIAQRYMLNKKSHSHRESGWVYFHGKRTAQLALSLRKRIFPNDASYDDILFAAALFHDVGKGDEPHNESGSRIVCEALAEEMQLDKLALAAEWIWQHNYRQRADLSLSDGAKLLMDADLIDHTGSIDIWLGCTYMAYDSGNIQELLNYYHTKGLEELRSWPETLWFELSSLVLKERVDFEVKFFDRLLKEEEGQLLI